MNCLVMRYDMATTDAQSVTTESTISAIHDYVTVTARDSFTTHDIARHIGADETQVRAAFGWLARHKKIEIVPCVTCRRYTRTQGEEYSASVYRLRNSGMADIKTLMFAFCR